MILNKKIISGILVVLSTMGVSAQEATVSAGGEATGSNGSVSYSVGQVVYTTIDEGNGSVSQGVQQAYEIYETSTPEFSDIHLDVAVYPNPTSDFLVLSIDINKYTNASLILSDLNGKQIQKSNITEDKTSIDMNNLKQSEYFLSILLDKKELKTFKIIKK